MPKSKSRAVGRPIRPRPTNPVIAGRVPPSVHKRIQRAAKKSGRTMSEELAYLATLALDADLKFLADYLQRRDAEIEGDVRKIEARVAELESGETLSRIVEAAVTRALANKKETTS
jgi:hypothetical protein